MRDLFISFYNEVQITLALYAYGLGKLEGELH